MGKLILLLFFLPGILNAQTAFEGVITFKVNTTVKPHVTDERYIDYFQNKYGDSIRIYYLKDGSQLKKYFGKSESGFEWRIYDAKANVELAKWKGIDTIYKYSVGNAYTEFRSLKTGRTVNVLGKECRSVTVETYEPIGKETLLISYYYSGDEKIDPSSYTNWKDGYLDEVYKISQSHFLKTEMDLSPIIVNIEAIRIENGAMDPKMFALPAGIPVKNW